MVQKKFKHKPEKKFFAPDSVPEKAYLDTMSEQGLRLVSVLPSGKGQVYYWEQEKK